MKKYFFIAAVILTSGAASQATEIRGGRIDAAGKNVLLDVAYGGGCAEHNFTLKLNGGCAESYPVQCRAVLIHKTNDSCEAYIQKTISINLAESGIKGIYFENGSLRISVANSTGQNNSEVTIRLPSRSVPPRPASAVVTCTTHMESKLVLDPSGGKLELVTIQGKKMDYGIISSQMMSLESLPPVLQSTYLLDDGRKLVASFREGNTSGTAYFIRIDGSTSPSFQCDK